MSNSLESNHKTQGIIEVSRAAEKPAEEYISLAYQNILPQEITDYWTNESDTWSQRFQEQTLFDTILEVGRIPTINLDDLPEEQRESVAQKELKFNLPQWMISGNEKTASHFAVAFGCEAIFLNPSNEDLPELNQEVISAISGAISRIKWVENPQKNSSSLDKLRFLQEHQQKHAESLNNSLKGNRAKAVEYIDRLKNASMKTFVNSSTYSSIIFGRSDRGYMDFKAYKGPWTQGGMREEPLSPEHESKGVSIVFYRINSENFQKEFLVAYKKRDAFSRTHGITPSWQASMSRIEKGNHPDQDFNPNPAEKDLYQAFYTPTVKQGVDVAQLDLNANRNEGSPIAVATIDWDIYDENEQNQVSESVGLKDHVWLSEEQIGYLSRFGLMDKNGEISPAVNGFVGIAFGRKSLKEIRQDQANRKLSKTLQTLIEENPLFASLLSDEEVGVFLKSGEITLNSEATALFGLILSTVARHKDVLDSISDNGQHLFK